MARPRVFDADERGELLCYLEELVDRGVLDVAIHVQRRGGWALTFTGHPRRAQAFAGREGFEDGPLRVVVTGESRAGGGTG